MPVMAQDVVSTLRYIIRLLTGPVPILIITNKTSYWTGTNISREGTS
jgi:hypothetical protein